MHNQRLSKTPSSINTNSQAAEQNPKLAYRPFGSQIQKASAAPVTQSTKEDVAFAEQKMEAFGLELQAKYGKITPEGQERLTVLQAKMDGLLNSQLQHARRFSHNIANIPLRRPDTPTPIQAKLTIGEPGDKYEQEADETARQVVQRIHQPQSEKLQRESLPDEEDELQMKPLGNIQRESLPDEEEELQMKPMVQRVSDGGIAATQDLEASINQARGGGQPLTKNIREPMEQGFGADFSRVKVHTDTQSDQLNRAIQAKAFTTGQDVFFRQGEYNPGSRGGQELIAHELTHVVQQNGGAVQPTMQMKEKVNVNDDVGMEREADVMGANAMQIKEKHSEEIVQKRSQKGESGFGSASGGVVQRMIAVAIDDNQFISTKINKKRPRGEHGSQGDHTTPFTSLQNQIANAIENVTLDDAWVNLYDTYKVYTTLPGWELSKKHIKETSGSYVEGLLNAKGDIDALQTAVKEMLILRNQIALTSLPKGKYGNAEGKWAGSLHYQERQFQLDKTPQLDKNEVIEYIWKAFDHSRLNALKENKKGLVLEQHARTMADAYPQLNESLDIGVKDIADYYYTKKDWIKYSPQS